MLISRVDHSAVVRPRVARFMGEGLGWVEGEQEHKEMRRLSMPALTCISRLFCLSAVADLLSRSDNIRRMSPEITQRAEKVSRLSEFPSIEY